ncbi:MAG: PilZ domain-containing protein [Myxococcota bacterium]|nr:PilZ domain-containing protein [Myxococcota bacterium]
MARREIWTAPGVALYDPEMSIDASRSHRRHLVQAECIVRSAEDGRLLADRTLDLSYSGARVAALGDARVGERVQMSLAIPGTSVWIDAGGRVERVLPGRRYGETGAALGVRIDRMDGMRRLLLAQVVRSYPEVARGRGPRRDYAETVARIGRDG